LKEYGDIDSKFRYVILAAMRAKQLLAGAKPYIKSRSKNPIRIAQEEMKQGLVDYEIIKEVKGNIEDVSAPDKEIFIGDKITPEAVEKPKKKSSKDKKQKKGKKA
jgi:DNA-directed RNA polymerase subunit omega